ncbi:MAG: NlpC/P60 family protein [Candidatus Angelobacter sp.]
MFVLGAFCLLGAAGNLMAQQETHPAITKFISDVNGPSSFLPRPLAPKELLLQMGTQIQATDLDCSHFVQWLFDQAGLYYEYAPSRTLYDGMYGFKRVSRPRPGDLVVWRGHVGIVVDPEETTFLSALRSGVKTSSYTSHYWKRRGRVRFYRYMESQGVTVRRQAAQAEREVRMESGSE